MDGIKKKIIVCALLVIMQVGIGASATEASVPSVSSVDSSQSAIQLDDRHHNDRRHRQERERRERERREHERRERERRERERHHHRDRDRDNDNEIGAFIIGAIIGSIIK